MTARVITQGTRPSMQALERSCGLPAPLDEKRHYRVEPGDGEHGPEYFPRLAGESGLTGLSDAIARAAWLSVASPPQRVVQVRPDTDTERVVRRYRGGHELAAVTHENENRRTT